VKVSFVLGAQDDPIVLALDVTNPASAEAAVQAGVDRFGRIDVLVNDGGQLQRRVL
jgi:NAD(P)-dependent dehydrogenase (short-subunit alcohol dehydrogenase family)